jgi:hypothetical protein
MSRIFLPTSAMNTPLPEVHQSVLAPMLAGMAAAPVIYLHLLNNYPLLFVAFS